MTVLSNYATGTVAIAASATSVVGTGPNWTGQNAAPGDTLVVAGHQVVVRDVVDATHLTIDAWPFTAVTAGTAYILYKTGPSRYSGGAAIQSVSDLVAALNTTGYFVFVGAGLTVPDPSYGSDGQFAYQPGTGKLWLKISGAWTLQGSFKGFNVIGPWSSATAYNPSDVVSLAGTSYVCLLANTNQTPPNATYWMVLAAVGATGSTGATGAGYGGSSTTSLLIAIASKVFTTQAGLAYQVGNYVRASSAANGANYMEGNVTAYSSTTLTINVTRIGGSGTLADWNFASAGAPGSGDLLSTNNLSDVTNKALARANLAAQAQGDFAGMSNGTLVASASAGALTIAVKTFAGADPSAGDPVYFYFRDNTLTAGDFTRIAVTAAMSILIGSGTTLGATSGFGLRVWVTAHNDAGTVRLGTINCSDGTSVFCPQEHTKYTTATPNNSAKVFYSTVAVSTAAPWRFLGFCEWTSLTTAGTWTTPTIVHLFGPGSKKPGDIVQHGFFTKVTTASTTSSTMTAAGLNALLTPTSTANLIVGHGSAPGFCATASKNQFSVVRRGASTNVSTFNEFFVASTVVSMASWSVFDKPNSLSQQTYDVYFANGDNATSISMPYCADGGTMYLNLQELMG